MRTKLFSAITLAILALGLNGQVMAATYRVAAGTPFHVRLDSKISTEDARSGDTWTGTVSQSVYSRGEVVIPAGSPVSGVVTSSRHGTHSTRPQLDLAVRQVTVEGRTRAMNAHTPTIVAGSKRAKKIGAIAGGAAAGALLGHAVGGGKKGAVIGGVVGGAATYGLTRNAFRTLQLKSGTVVTFTTSENVAMRR